MNFTNKVALVTGASVGIGRAVALQMAKNGAKLVLFDVNYEKLKEVKKELEEYTKDVLIFDCDVSDEQKVYEYVSEGEKTFGKIDILVNNAALWRVSRPPKVRPKSNDWEVGFSMAKYSYEFKKKVVQAYLDCKGGYEYLAKHYNIPDKKQVRIWVNAYKEFGDAGLVRSRQNKNYSFQFKLNVVELYLSSEISYQELALSQGINNPALITKWVGDFRIAGPDALRPKKKGRKKILDIREFEKPAKSSEEKSIDTSAERIKQLEDELLKLRIENAYLKELRRLRLEEEALRKKQRELSTVSEDNSN